MITTQKKLRVGLIYGGRSGEHEISLASATSVMNSLDRNKYEVVPIGITKDGAWLPGVSPAMLLAEERAGGIEETPQQEDIARLPEPVKQHYLLLMQEDRPLPTHEALDVAFPVLHGTYGEDGTLQGLLEMADVPYVGCGVLGSALGMDKEKAKLVFRSVGLPITDFLTYRRYEWERSADLIMDTIEAHLGYPCFVKPSNLGSSIGISKAVNRCDLENAMHLAAEYDSKIVVEHAINCRELECSVLGNHDPIVSMVGEVIMSSDFYDYEAKYLDNTSYTVAPADIPEDTAEEIRRQALQAFLALDLSGLARVDFFLERETGNIFINEVNTLPSFTPQCMYPKLCEASGLSYPHLLDRLIELAIERYGERQRNRISM